MANTKVMCAAMLDTKVRIGAHRHVYVTHADKIHLSHV